MSISDVVELIRRWSDRPVIGCTDEVVAEICAVAPGPLPRDYLEWLRLAGQSPGNFMLGTDIAAPLVPRMQESMRATSLQFGGPQFPLDAFVFANHQVYVYLWFHAQGDHDRRVFRYMQMARESVVVGKSFTEVLEWTARDEYGLK